MKKFYFLLSLPRAGNTLFGSLVNNNNRDVVVTGNDSFLNLLYSIYKIKEERTLKYFPDINSYNNVYKNIFNNYFKDFKQKHIILRGPYGTPLNLKIIKEFFPRIKFIVLKRPTLECLASLIKIYKPENIEHFVDSVMDQNGLIGKDLWSMNNVRYSKENHLEISYEELCNETSKFFKKLNIFLDTDIQYNTKEIKDFTVNGIKYNDDYAVKNLHKLKTKIIKSELNINKYLPKHIIERYNDYN